MNEIPLLADGVGYIGFFSDFNTTFWSGVLRIAYAMVAAAPFLMAGVLAAGILRGMVGTARVRKILGVGHWSGPLRAWGVGVLLPICSLGALPVARELRRAGIPSGTVLSFVLVAPVLNPVSIVYGLSHIEPVTLIYFAIGTFVVSTGIGMVWNWCVAGQKDVTPDNPEQPPRHSLHRVAVVGDTAARSLFGPTMFDYGLALLAVGFLGAFLPHGILQTGMTRDNIFAPVIMGLVAIPVYVTPTDVMMHFGHIVRDGYSLGAAFALIVLGAGANVGVANWLRRDYGFRPLMLFVGLLIGSTLVIGFTADRTIVHGNATMEDHTHAFDSFTRVSKISSDEAGLTWVVKKVRESIQKHETAGMAEVVGLCLLGLIFTAGLILRLTGDRFSVEHLLQPSGDTNEKTAPSWDPTLTPKQLVLISAGGVVILAGIGLYVFYPDPETLMDEMRMIRVEAYDAVRAEDTNEFQRRIAQWRRQAEKLPTSNLIRGQSVTDRMRENLSELLYGLETLEDHMASRRFDDAKMMKTYIERLFRECCDEFNQVAVKPN
ncbi:MAG: permease [Fuerstiella sp.]|nr:permease [Fuerstiella sp.]